MNRKRITRGRRLTPVEAARYKAVREQVAAELPDLIARHHKRAAALDQWQDLLAQLKAARQAKGLSLAGLTELTGMDRSALSKLETGRRPNPTVETLVRYAEAVGQRPVISLADAQNRIPPTLGRRSSPLNLRGPRTDAEIEVIRATLDDDPPGIRGRQQVVAALRGRQRRLGQLKERRAVGVEHGRRVARVISGRRSVRL